MKLAETNLKLLWNVDTTSLVGESYTSSEWDFRVIFGGRRT
jgi:hypothetical protein